MITYINFDKFPAFFIERKWLLWKYSYINNGMQSVGKLHDFAQLFQNGDGMVIGNTVIHCDRIKTKCKNKNNNKMRCGCV